MRVSVVLVMPVIMLSGELKTESIQFMLGLLALFVSFAL
jgi:hypothetical protein